MVWDAQRIVQVLTNLIANAAHAIGHDGRLTIRGHRADGWLTLEVRDTGPGIAAALRSRVFDPFFTTKPDGTGLGLSISHGIVSAHGGRIEVGTRTRDEGAPGEVGTLMRLILPVISGAPQIAGSIEPARGRSGHAPDPLTSPTPAGA